MNEHVAYHHIADTPGLVLSEARFTEYSFDRHFHLDYHIGLVTEGVQRQRFGGKAVLWGRGCIALMPPGEIHDGVREGESAYTLKTFRLSSGFLHDVAEELTGNRREPELTPLLLEDRTLASRLMRVHSAMQLNDGKPSLNVQSEWLTTLHHLFARSRMIKPQAIKGALTWVQQQRVREYCFANLAEKITLEELAALCGLGRFQFLRQFKQTVGMTPHAWLVRLRLEHACSLLGSSSQSVAQVAQRVGFYDQSHFNRAFRQAYGVAPSHY
jgi:AraC-like DNA-binding protein